MSLATAAPKTPTFCKNSLSWDRTRPIAASLAPLGHTEHVTSADRRELSWEDQPDLVRPVLLLAFDGLFDVGGAATGALRWLSDRWPATPVAAIDPDRFFDFTQQRPEVRIDEDGERVIDWPENRCIAVRPATAGAGKHDLVILSGVEPHLRWRTFAQLVAEVATDTGAELVITLGAAPGHQPHTRPFRVVGSTTRTEVARRLGLNSPSYQGPTGVVGVLHDTLDRLDVPVISLRATLPPYVLGAPSPKATQALLRRLDNMLAVDTGHRDGDDEVAAWERDVDEAVAQDIDAAVFVRQLEEDFQREPDSDIDITGDGDDLADEIEAFLRDQRPPETP